MIAGHYLIQLAFDTLRLKHASKIEVENKIV